LNVLDRHGLREALLQVLDFEKGHCASPTARTARR